MIKKTNLFVQIGVLFIATLILAFGCNLMINASCGTDSITILYLGCASFFNVSVGSGTLIAYGVFTLLILIVDRKKVGIATIFMLAFLGQFINMFSLIAFPAVSSFSGLATLGLSLFYLCTGLLFASFGVALYIKSNTGMTPFEALIMFFAEKTGISFGKVKIVNDIILFAMGFALGGKLGFGSLITVFFYGPLIDVFLKMLSPIPFISHMNLAPQEA